MTDFEIPTRFPYLDSSGFGDGRFGSAERRRMQILQNNRLAGKGGHAFHIVGNLVPEVFSDYYGDGGISGYGSVTWKQITVPRIVKKKPQLNRCRMRIRYLYPEGGGWSVSATKRDERALQFQVTTRAYPFLDNASASTANHLGTVQFNKNNSPADLVSIVDLPVDPGEWETFRFFIKGGLTTELMVEGTYGINNAGTANNYGWYGPSNSRLDDSSSSWVRAIASGGHYLVIDELAGNYDIVGTNDTGQVLFFDPPTPREITNNGYSIYQLHPWQLVSVACYFYNRER